MSYLQVKKGKKRKFFHLDDGKSGLLHRTVDLDTLEIRSIMGKQIYGKDVDPDGELGRKLIRTAVDLWNEDS